MNPTVEILIVGLIVAAAAAFVVGKIVGAARGKRSSCCGAADPDVSKEIPDCAKRGCSGCGRG